MTDNRAFKKLIRDYMDQHGVSYNKALKDVRLTTFSPSLSAQLPLEFFKELQSLKQGMILVSSMTGHGKTTVLGEIQRFYLDPRNSDQRRIVNISPSVQELEKPLRSEAKNFFAYYPGLVEKDVKGYIRHAMRMRPDVITFDEIRDGEAAHGMAMSSLTGHLSVATVHSHKPEYSVKRLHNLLSVSPHGNYPLGKAVNVIVHVERDREKNHFSIDAYRYDSEMEEILQSGDLKSHKEELQKRKF